MLTRMGETDWIIVLEVFDGAQSRRGGPGHDDRKFLEAERYFTAHNITWRRCRRSSAKGTAFGNGSGG